jgi:hypothetical protein
VYVEAYERNAVSVRPLIAYVAFYRDGRKVFETDGLGVSSWDAKTKALPIRFTITARAVDAGSYDCQVTVLDPADGHAAFWRGAIVIR